MSKVDRMLIAAISILLLALGVINFLTTMGQQKALETLVEDSVVSVGYNWQQGNQLQELRRRIDALEREVERQMSHIKWFVMRRSGTDELRKMETAVTKLEAAK